MRHSVSILLMFTIGALSAPSTSAQSPAAAGFEKLKSLVGEWQSKSPDGQSVTVSYQILSGGVALMETLKPANEPGMVSIYHIDGADLRMTHFCTAGNQPRMRAKAPSGEIKQLRFVFVDATNLAKSSDDHIRGLTITFQDKDHITQEWAVREGGKDSFTTHKLERKK
ncbi:MAG TPA: hypothetical protein VJ810_30605 [Blastocatellia bacterium]|nr:hypothetical protein [Blastocatellia bacterium]